MKISFVNDMPYPCGCKCKTSSGRGEYSDIVEIELCEKHSPQSDPKKDAIDAGYVRVGDGSWQKTG